MGKGTRTVAAVGGALLFLGGVAAGVAVWHSSQPGAAAYRVWLQGVPAAESADWNTGDTDCPSSGRGVGPIGADDRAVPALSPGGPGQQVGAGQFLAYHVRVDADPLAPTTSDLTADLAFSGTSGTGPVDLSSGILCAFVDEGDPLNTSPAATAALGSSTLADDGTRLTATVDVKGVEAGTSAVVEIWLKAAATQPRSTSVFQASVNRVTAAPATRARVMASTARLVTSSQQSRDIELELVGPDDADLEPGQDVQLTMRVRNTADDAVGRDVVAHFKADPTLVIKDVTISDEAGAATTCELSAGVVTCTAPYLVPDERVTVVIAGTLAADAPRVFAGAGPACAPQAQDLCVTADLSTASSPAGPRGQAELAIDLPAPDFISATKLADGSAGLYVGRSADFVYVIAAGTDEPIEGVTIVDPSCSPVTFVSGDDGADTILGPGERWTYRCSGMVDRAQTADVTVSGTTASGQSARAVTRLATPVLDPGVSIATATDQDDPAVQVVNTGSSELTGIVVTGRECAAEVDRGDADDDGVLDPGERWIFPCRSSSGAVRVYATDPGGGAVTAVEE